jgi:hypothetical protein
LVREETAVTRFLDGLSFLASRLRARGSFQAPGEMPGAFSFVAPGAGKTGRAAVYKGEKEIANHITVEKVFMRTYACLTHIAQYEVDALLQEAAAAIHGLERQRQSAMHDLQAARQAGEQAGPQPLEMAMLEMELADKLGRLNAALDQALCEIERAAAGTRLAPALALPPRQASRERDL